MYDPSSHDYRPMLGPCRCQGCGEPLWWAKRQTRHLGNPIVRAAWREEDGCLHQCPNFAPINARRRAVQ